MSLILKLKELFNKDKRSKFYIVQQELFNSNYIKANSLLDDIDKDPNNSVSDQIRSLTLRSFVSINQNNPPKGLELADSAIQKYSDNLNVLLLLEATLAKAFSLYDLNKVPDCLNCLDESEELFNSLTISNKDISNELQAKIHYLRGRIAHRKQRDIENALKELNKALEFSKLSQNLDGLADINAEIGVVYFVSGSPDLSINSLSEAIDIFRKLNNKNKLLKAYNNIGLIYQRMQNQEESLKYLLLTMNLLEELGDKFRAQSGVVSLNIGVLYIDQGELNKALNYLNNANKIFDEIGARDQKAFALNAMATIYELKGDIDLSLKTYNECLKIFEELDIKSEIGPATNNIGNAYQIKGAVDQAIPCYIKALEFATESNDPVQMCIPLYNLVINYALMDDIEKANEYLTRLEQIIKGTDQRILNQIFRLSKANILKRSKRIIKKAEAQLIFQQISYEEIIRYEMTTDAMFNLCEMLIQELRSSGNEDIIKEVKDVVSKLIETAQKENSFYVLVQAKLLQSKIALLELDLNTSKSVLNEAQQIAVEKGLDHLAAVVSGEYDALIDQFSKWTDLIDSNVSMIERLEMAELEGLVSNMVRKKTDTSELLNEIPELFLILNDQGMKIFSKVFTSESKLDDQVVGDLLTAVNSFLQETFSASGSIERLKHKEHTLMLKPIDKYLTCYVFKGQSYSALQKLEKFIDKVQTNEELYHDILDSKDEIVNENFSSVVTEIFA